MAADKRHTDFTPSEHGALYSFKVNYTIRRFNSNLQMKRTFPFKYLVYANNRTIFLFVVSVWDSRILCAKTVCFVFLIGMKLAEVVCSCVRPAKFD